MSYCEILYYFLVIVKNIVIIAHHSKFRAVAEPRLGLEGPGLTLGSQYIDQKLELIRALFEEARPGFLAGLASFIINIKHIYIFNNYNFLSEVLITFIILFLLNLFCANLCTITTKIAFFLCLVHSIFLYNFTYYFYFYIRLDVGSMVRLVRLDIKF
jgi:hypothetical protein